MKKQIINILLMISIAVIFLTACDKKSDDESKKQVEQTETSATSQDTDQSTQGENSEKKDDKKEEKVEKISLEGIEVEAASKDEFDAFVQDDDDKTIIVDARPQEAYAGWAIEGAKNGGHIKGAILYSARWLDFEMDEAKRQKKISSYNEAINLNNDNKYIVYDYNGFKNAAENVAKFFKTLGIENVKYYDAKDLIDSNSNIVKYKNYDYFMPAEIVKVISDYKSGLTDELNVDITEQAGINNDNIDRVILVDVSYGNVHESSYLSEGHVPGAVHVNTNAYERPRNYTPEKREKYALEYSLIPLEEFRDVLCPEYGINKDSIVIAMSTDGRPIARFGFMLKSIGVKYYGMSALMNGWNYNEYKLDSENVVKPISVESFGSKEIPNPNALIWMDEVKKILNGEEEGTIVGGDDFHTYDYHDLMGKIPGTVDEGKINDTNLDGTPSMPELIIAGYEKAGIPTDKLIVPFCGDGWGASRTAYNAQSVDITNVKAWGEGWVVWSNRGNEFETYDGRIVKYDKYIDKVVDREGNIIEDEKVMKSDDWKEDK